MKTLLSLLALLSLSTISVSQSYVIRNSGEDSYIYQTIQGAIQTADSGDVITLNGGTYIEDILIYKAVTIVGVGFYVDSTLATLPTVLAGDVLFDSGSSGSRVEGLSCENISFDDESGDTPSINGVTISRVKCNLLSVVSDGNSSTVKNLLIQECVIEDELACSNKVQNMLVANTLIVDQIRKSSGSTFENCLFLYSESNFPVVNETETTLFENCIFRTLASVQLIADTNTYQNCSFAFSDGLEMFSGEEFNINNLFDLPLSHHYEDQGGIGDTYTQVQDYRLKLSSTGFGYGTDGLNIGLYGGVSPWKDGNLPFIPHIQTSSMIDGETDPSGLLPVIIRVEAQER